MTVSTAKPTVCVFCASSPGQKPVHLESARSLGRTLTDANYKLVYGGGTKGIMGEISKTVVSLSSPENVLGIIPRALIQVEKESIVKNGDGDVHQQNGTEKSGSSDTKQAERSIMQEHLKRLDSHQVIPQSEFGETRIVNSMHERKAMMLDEVAKGGHGSGFVALAGGYGTLEEVMEMVTWNQLSIHKLPIVVVNVDGYWDGVLQWVRTSIDEGFVGKGNANILVEVKDPCQVVEALQNYKMADGRFELDWTTKQST